MNGKKEKEFALVMSWRWRIIRAGMSHREFARSLGRPASQISEWVCGKKHPKPETIRKIEAALKNLGV